MECINTDLNNTSIVHSLSIVITLADCLWNVAHDQQFLGLFSLVHGMIEYQIQNCFGNILVDAWLQDRLAILLQSILIGKLSESKLLSKSFIDFFHKVFAHKVHVLQNFEREFKCLLSKFVLDTDVSWDFVHKVKDVNKILKSFGVFNIALIDENEWFSKLWL